MLTSWSTFSNGMQEPAIIFTKFLMNTAFCAAIAATDAAAVVIGGCCATHQTLDTR
jgi:hypothetical protein